MKKLFSLFIIFCFLLPFTIGAQSITQIDITSGEITLEWNTVKYFTDGTLIDTTKFKTGTSLNYKLVLDTSKVWTHISLIYQPDTSYNLTEFVNNLLPGTYEFNIIPFVSYNETVSSGEITSSREMGWVATKYLLEPSKHFLFRVVVSSK